MPQHALSRFAYSSDADFNFLRARIDTCGQAGQAYVFSDCRLTRGCVPAVATVGFAAQKGGYLLYITPKVRYIGNNYSIKRFFEEGKQEFHSFEALRVFLQGFRENAPNASALQPSPAKSTVRAATLTAPDQVHLQRREDTRQPPDYETLLGALGEAVLGQDDAVSAVARGIYAHIHKKRPARPLSLIFHGPTGTGKSELGKQVAPALNRLYGEQVWQFVWTELNTFTEAHSVYRLTGAPPGYVGYDDRPVFEAVCLNPHTVFMFDELEKAHPEVLKTFMSILDEGRAAARKELSGHGRELDFRQCIFLFTTNTPLSNARRAPLGFSPEVYTPPRVDASPEERIFLANERARQLLAEQGCLREIAGRFSGFAEFLPLDDCAQVRVLAKQIAALGSEYGLQLSWIAPTIVQAVADRIGAGEAFSVRSHAGVIESCLTAFFSAQADSHDDVPLRLEGTLAHPELLPL